MRRHVQQKQTTQRVRVRQGRLINPLRGNMIIMGASTANTNPRTGRPLKLKRLIMGLTGGQHRLLTRTANGGRRINLSKNNTGHLQSRSNRIRATNRNKRRLGNATNRAGHRQPGNINTNLINNSISRNLQTNRRCTSTLLSVPGRQNQTIVRRRNFSFLQRHHSPSSAQFVNKVTTRPSQEVNEGLIR